jgi:hypothetical protein
MCSRRNFLNAGITRIVGKCVSSPNMYLHPFCFHFTSSLGMIFLGSTLYAMKTGEHPAILRNSVTSPAGTTASAVYELEKGGLRPLVNDAIWACYRRSLEMGGRNSSVGPRMVYNMGEKPDPTTQIHYMDHDKHTENVPSGEMRNMVDNDVESQKDEKHGRQE